MPRGDAARSFAESMHREMDRGLNDVRHSLVEEAWFGKQLTGDMSSVKVGAYDNELDGAVSLDTVPEIDNGVTIADATFGPQASSADIFGTPASGMATADTSVLADVESPEPEPSPEIEPEL